MLPKHHNEITEIHQQGDGRQQLSKIDHTIYQYGQAEQILPSPNRDTSGPAHEKNFLDYLQRRGAFSSSHEQATEVPDIPTVTERGATSHETQQQLYEDETGPSSKPKKDLYDEVPKPPTKIEKSYYTQEDGKILLAKAEASIESYKDTADNFKDRYTPTKPLRKMNSFDGTHLLHLVGGDPFPG
jgi:hypothetical protein